MAVDMFLIIKDLPGECEDKEFGSKNAIDVVAWNWSMSQSATTHVGQGGGSGKVTVNDITFTKHIDKSSPNLIKACCTGKHYPTAELMVRKAGGDAALVYLQISLEDVLVSSVTTGAVSSDDRIQEQVTLNFRRFKMVYKPQSKTGAAGGPVTAGFDIAANASFG